MNASSKRPILVSVAKAAVFGVILGASPTVLGQAADAPVADCLGASNASIRFDNEHRLRAERAELLICAAAACPVDIRNECIRRVDEVNAAIPSVIFGVKDSEGNDLAAVKVIMDREVLTDRLQGLAVSIDPGLHTFVFEAPGLPTLRKQFVIRQGQKNRAELVTLGSTTSTAATASGSPSSSSSAAGDSLSPAAFSSVPSSASIPSSASRDEGETMGTQKKLAIGVATLGVVGVGLGTVFGLQARAKRDDAKKICPTVCNSQNGVDIWHEAKQVGNLSTVAFVAGGVGLAGALLLWVSASPHAAVTPTADVAQGRLSVALAGKW